MCACKEPLYCRAAIEHVTKGVSGVECHNGSGTMLVGWHCAGVPALLTYDFLIF